ncbi:sigma 54-interacting transcriptional regulator [Rhodoblastus acidophilus]|uniref:Sigma 54-interacting transcriptional regulator n=1 Tax=Candidatus Rhodoblastus alkanivorans TaxID=2954117 RepID=A0ABS9Z823_9HYPH|nr:sigma-54-dependent Fis family transcriptional regulator [Candidatus Rhodoblastus alkanivorans]MCI4677902.1 sigma 54-interacting transcriptional regulator [Candidatus Rhodoblastus alkanivorans]MCI4683798.1 sigma 54-interacting transcriptional regulator [Candidatus Rhodoblastus alkanivorans]MDI4641116.1 sigma 54-interacting transcriptional regulator [Rhodoblastus acidophilus]
MSKTNGPGASRTPSETGGDLDRALREHLHFSPDAGHILLYGQRMLLFHAAAFADLRRELIERLGLGQAREIMMRLGYQQGFDDGVRIREDNCRRKVDEMLSMGPRLREMEGFVRNHPIDAMVCDGERGAFWGNYFWSASFEAQAHLDHCGPSGEPACWMMVGYANGYCTAVTGMPILWRELECVAMGHSRCRVVGRALADWRNLDEDEAGLLQLTPLAAPGAGAGPIGEAFDNFVGSSAGFKAAADMVRRAARADATVLFLGESGVGKERFARALHAMSRRADKPFVAVNCAAIPQELVESELFGVERGAYTGADRARPGRFERADGGMLFLDEIASLPLPAQGKLLRALQEREIERVGDTRVRKVDVRIVAAANQDLRKEVAEGRFRADLFYRINVYPVSIPPLRHRRDDIPLLVSFFIQRISSQYDKRIAGFTRRAHRALWDYDWPGNVRELENIIERAVILCDDHEAIDIRHLFTGGEEFRAASFEVGLDGAPRDGAEEAPAPLVEAILADFYSFEALERDLLRAALQQANGNLSAAARLLKMRRGQFEYRLKKHAQEMI